jgi:hypothetical protein
LKVPNKEATARIKINKLLEAASRCDDCIVLKGEISAKPRSPR